MECGCQLSCCFSEGHWTEAEENWLGRAFIIIDLILAYLRGIHHYINTLLIEVCPGAKPGFWLHLFIEKKSLGAPISWVTALEYYLNSFGDNNVRGAASKVLSNSFSESGQLQGSLLQFENSFFQDSLFLDFKYM